LTTYKKMNTVEGFEHESVASRRTIATLLSLFAALAVLISASGIAAAIALAVSERSREIGIRMALGARRASLLRMILRQSPELTLAGRMRIDP